MALEQRTFAGENLEWAVGAAPSVTNHPDIEVVAAQLDEISNTQLDFVALGGWTLGGRHLGNAYSEEPGGVEYHGGDVHVDMSARTGFNARNFPNPGIDVGFERLSDLLDIAASNGTEVNLNLYPIGEDTLAELYELVELSRQALDEGVLTVEINLSCQNVPGRPPMFLDAEALAQFNDYVSDQPVILNKNGVPGLYVKYGPIAWSEFDPDVHGRAIPSVGGRITTNTMGHVVPVDDEGEKVIRYNQGKAGMSGPALQGLGRDQLALWVAQCCGEEIVSVMGVDSGEEVYERFRYGAAAVQLAAILKWPELVECESSQEAVEHVWRGYLEHSPSL